MYAPAVQPQSQVEGMRSGHSECSIPSLAAPRLPAMAERNEDKVPEFLQTLTNLQNNCSPAEISLLLSLLARMQGSYSD